MNLDNKKNKKLEKLAEIVSGGEGAIIKQLFELDTKIKEYLASFNKNA